VLGCKTHKEKDMSTKIKAKLDMTNSVRDCFAPCKSATHIVLQIICKIIVLNLVTYSFVGAALAFIYGIKGLVA